MAEIKIECEDCHQKKIVTIGQIVSFGLGWFESHRCPFCGLAMEVDGRGFPPEEIRQIILAQDGEYQLVVDDSIPKNKVISVNIIRKVFRVSISEATALLKRFPYLAKGTKVEMQWLQKLLLEKNIKSCIKLVA